MTDVTALIGRLDAYHAVTAKQAQHERSRGRVAEAAMLDTCAALHEQAAAAMRTLLSQILKERIDG
jgi:hypothetical protein